MQPGPQHHGVSTAWRCAPTTMLRADTTDSIPRLTVASITSTSWHHSWCTRFIHRVHVAGRSSVEAASVKTMTALLSRRDPRLSSWPLDAALVTGNNAQVHDGSVTSLFAISWWADADELYFLTLLSHYQCFTSCISLKSSFMLTGKVKICKITYNTSSAINTLIRLTVWTKFCHDMNNTVHGTNGLWYDS